MNNSKSDHLKQEFLVELGKQCLEKLKVNYTETFLKEAIGKAYMLTFETEYTDGDDLNKITVADKEDPGNLAIVLLEALKRYHVKNEVGNVVGDHGNAVTLLVLSSSYERYDYRHLLTVQNGTSNMHEPVTKTIENLVILKTNKFTAEPGYLLNRNRERLTISFKCAVALLLIVSVGRAIYNGSENDQWLTWLPHLFLLLAGCCVCYHLYKLEKADSYVSKLLEKICTTKKNDFNCRDVISSPASKLFGIVSQTDLGVIYFSGMFSFVTLSLINNTYANSLSLLFWLSLLPLPYSVFSIYYQFVIIKKRCVLCLTTQLILWTNAYVFIYLSKQIKISYIDPEAAIQFGCIVSVITALYFSFIESKKAKARAEKLSMENFKIKNTTLFFEEAMSGQMKFIQDDFPVTFSWGDASANEKIQVILSLFCSPCGEKLNDLLRLSDWFGDHVELHLIIKPDAAAIPLLKELLTCSDNGDVQRGLDMLVHWYAFFKKEKERGNDAPSVCMKRWKEYYPLASVSEEIQKQCNYHRHFYENFSIPFTPLIQYNEKLLPGTYQDMELLSNRIEQRIEQQQNLEYA